jgi:hypothetical protein
MPFFSAMLDLTVLVFLASFADFLANFAVQDFLNFDPLSHPLSR